MLNSHNIFRRCGKSEQSLNSGYCFPHIRNAGFRENFKACTGIAQVCCYAPLFLAIQVLDKILKITMSYYNVDK